MSKMTSSIELGFIRLNRRKREPLATQLYCALSQAILEGQLAKGFRLPSTRGLATDLGVSRTTVINAFDQLAAEGYLTSAVGKGTFVSDELPEENQLVNFQTPVGTKRSRKIADRNHSPTPTKQPTQKRRRSTLGEYAVAIESHEDGLPDASESLSPFLPGVPALDEFPIEVWSRLVRRRWKSVRTSSLSYGSSAGHGPLRTAIAEYVRAFRGVQCDEDQVFVVAGTQQAVDLVARLTLNRGDKVLFENPGYPRARTAFEVAGASIVPIDVDESGLDVEQAIAKAADARLAYVTPSHQFPMGVTLSIERRMKLVEWARESGGLIFEDDYDSEYRYSHRPIPSLQGLGNGEQTIYVGSFSKVIFPSLGMGYIVVPKWMISVVSKSLGLWSRPPAMLDQLVLTDFIAEEHFARHLRRMRQIHHQRRTALVESIERHLADQLKIVGCDAGLHCAALLLQQNDDRAISASLEQIGIVARSISHYAVDRKFKTPGLVLGFASSTPARIKNAVKKMRDVLR